MAKPTRKQLTAFLRKVSRVHDALDEITDTLAHYDLDTTEAEKSIGAAHGHVATVFRYILSQRDKTKD